MEVSHIPVMPNSNDPDEPDSSPTDSHQPTTAKPVNHKHKKPAKFKRSLSLKGLGIIAFLIIFAASGSYLLFKSFAAPGGGGKKGGGTTSTTPLSVSQDWQGYWITAKSCFGGDSNANWQGTGTLAPGQSFTFTPSYPTCYNSEAPVISMHADWSGSTQLKLETTTAFVPHLIDDKTLIGQHIVVPIMAAPNSRQQTNLCMITDASMTDNLLGLTDYTTNTGPPINWSMTITNTGTQTANVSLDGQQTNGWAALYYPNCIRGDADGDHWNDSLEYTIDFYGGIYGSNYLRGSGVYKQQSADLADLNSDNVISQLDVDAIQANIGKGTGQTIDQLNSNGWSYTSNIPNPDCYKGAGSIGGNQQAWRHYDLDGDGCITQHDVSEVQTLVGKTLPITQDYFAPWAVNLTPSITAGVYQSLWAFASDNDSLTHVDFVVSSGGKTSTVCSDWHNGGKFEFLGGTTPTYVCGYTAPRSKGATVNVTINAYDNNGHSYSTTKAYVTQ